MARKTAEFTLEVNGKTEDWTIYELRVRTILELFEKFEKNQNSETETDQFKRLFNDLLPKITDLTFEEMKDLAPSELMQGWNIFKEVNADFFVIAQTIGLGETVKAMKEMFVNNLLRGFASSSEEAIPEP
jgi:hypothetical protein